MKKKFFISLSCLLCQSMTSQNIKTDTIIFTEQGIQVTYTKNGVTKTELAKPIPDSIAQKQLEAEMKQFGVEPNKKDDTIFTAFHKPLEVIMGNDLFGATRQRFTYDRQHRLIKITGYHKREVKPFDYLTAIRIFTYDARGNEIEIRNLDEHGKLISSKYEFTPILKKVYNSQNQLIEEWFLNEKEQLRDEFAILKYSYDADGKRTQLGWFNLKGEKGR